MLPLLGGPGLEEQRRVFQEEINKRERHLLDAKRQLNSLAPILRLPPELLSEVLLHFVEAWIVDSDPVDPSSTSTPYGWLKATHVCHHWREVALRTPRLWSTIVDFGNTAESVDEMIARSGQAALYATVNSNDVAFNPVMEQIHRVARLDVELHNLGGDPSVIRSAPKLARIAVSLCPCFDVDSPCLFRDCELPKLTHLDLNRGSFLWSRPLFKPTVTHLCILGPDRIERQFGMQDLLLALESLPLLENLVIRGEIPHQLQYGPIPPPLRVLPLPHLKLLHLDDHLEACAALLLHISYPSTTTLKIESRLLEDYSVEPLGLVELAKAIKVKLSQSIPWDVKEPRLATLSVTHEHIVVEGVLPRDGFRLRVWTTKHHVTAFGSTEETLPPPVLEVSLRGMPIDIQDFFEYFFPFLPLSTLETLYLSHPLNYYTEAPELLTWRNALQPMTHLRELGLGSFAEDVVPDVLSLDRSAPDAGLDGQRRIHCILPALEVLFLHEVALRPTYEAPGDTVVVEAYRDMLALRRDAQHTIGQIILDRCANVTASDIALLEALVKVQWNPEDVEKVDRAAEHIKAAYDLAHPHGLPDIPGLVVTMLQGIQDI